ncbi:MAG: DUF6443 domain-containing protein [Bacteroidales bacterium]
MSLSNTFSNASDGSGEFTLNQYHLSGESMCYNTSYLSSSEIYDSSNTMVQKTTYQYSSDSGDQLLNMGFYHMVYYDYPQAEYDSERLTDYAAINRMFTKSGNDAVPPLYYYIYTSSRGVRYPCGETVESYYGSTTYTEQRTQTYDLTKSYHYPTKISQQCSDGRSMEYQLYYPFDYSTALTDSLIGRHKVSVLIEQKRYMRTSSSSATLVDRYKTDYARYGSGTTTFYRPSAVWYTTGSNTLEQRKTYSYDSKGKPSTITYNNDDRENYVWSYNHQYPVAMVRGAAYSEMSAAVPNIATISDNASVSDATIAGMLTSFRGINNSLTEGLTYKPLYGVSSMLSATGNKKSYTYDNFTRLTDVKDNDGKIVTNIVYGDGSAAGATYITSSEPDTAVTSISSIAASSRGSRTLYYDGIYREVQQVGLYFTPSKTDLVGYTSYDVYGRAVKQALPYASSTGSGSYRTSAASEQTTYYNTLYSGQGAYASSRTEYEASQVGRPLKEYLPGSGSYTTTAVTSYAYGTNGASEVTRWTLNSSGNVVNSGYYTAGVLQKVTATDPDQRVSVTYVDKLGRSIETRAGSSTPLKTSYVYDDIGHLVRVVTPLAQATSTVNNTLCIKYGYDHRGRLIESSSAEKGTTYYVYDGNDRVVATQDALQRVSNKWSFTRYDRLGREVYSGEVSNTSSVATIRNAYKSNVYHESLSGSGAIGGYSNTSQTLSITINNVLSITYYDGYGYSGVKSFVAGGAIVGQGTGYTPVTSPKGLVTGSKIKVLDGNETTSSAKWLLTTYYYNAKEELVQSAGDIYNGTSTSGLARNSTLYRHR